MCSNAGILAASPYRLSTAVKPSHYEIELDCDMEGFTYQGRETIEIEVTGEESVDQILLNSVDISFVDVKLTEMAGSNKEHTGKYTVQEGTERVAFDFGQPIAPGHYRLHIQFAGVINDKLRGFYRSAQTLPDGSKKWIGVTQMEPTDARRVFPCFDEPALKATFKLTLIVAEHLDAISNTPVASQSVITAGRKKVVFEPTMHMATYIVAFVVGEFDKSDTVDVDGVPFTIYAPLGKKHLSSFALQIGASALSFFNKYYGIKYPGAKMDMIAVPDFAFGAMENLGCVIYRENALLVDPARASHAEVERVADVVAHELAHMWFGNLTTMKWWNGIWLNEAFATFMQLVAVDNFKHEWKRFETFGVSRAMAFATDGLSATRPIEFPVDAPAECTGMFDVLTYEKGASVLRMLEQYIGPDVFKMGVNNYLQTHKYSNTETEDLWLALAQASGLPVREIMNSWIFQKGHPLIDVTINGERAVKFTQKRFFYLASEHASGAEHYQVPLLVRAKTKQADGSTKIESHHMILKRGCEGESAEGMVFDGEIQYVVVNAGGHGFYRVAYDQSLLQGLYAALQAGDLSTLERFNFVSDMFALTQNGTMTLDQMLDVLERFDAERDKNVWAAISGALIYADRFLPAGSSKRARVAETARKLARPVFDELGFAPAQGKVDQENELTRQLRGIVISLLGIVGGDDKVRRMAAELFDAGSHEDLSADVLSAIVMILAHTGDAARYADFVERYKKGDSPQVQERYMFALAAFPHADLLQKTLSMTLNGEIKGQNAPYVVRNLMLNPAGRLVGWQFMSQKWDEVTKLFPAMILTRLVEGVTGLADPVLAREVFAFFADHNVEGGEKTVAQHLEKLRVALAFAEANA
jgi:puromycin-sensitive aminopeptidase